MSVLERLNGGNRARRGLSVSVRPVHLVLGLAAVALAISAWAAGMRAGYGYAKRDAAAILAVGMENETPTVPEWRAWADTPVPYTPPADLALLFGVVGREIPYSGGMTTGDVWNGYQTRIQHEFFGLKPVAAASADTPAPPAPASSEDCTPGPNCAVAMAY